MRAIITVVAALVIVSTATAQWYAGGTLHRATGAEWQQATAANRLATVSDMVAALVKRGDTKIEIRRIDDLKPYAKALSKCVTEATKDTAGHEQKVAGIAAACMILMGWVE